MKWTQICFIGAVIQNYYAIACMHENLGQCIHCKLSKILLVISSVRDTFFHILAD